MVEKSFIKLYNIYGDYMKKIYIILILFLIVNISSVKAEEIKFNKCIDGDTISLKVNGKVRKMRFLAVDAPEIKHGDQKGDPFGDEARIYTCMKLKMAKEIILEYDNNSDKKDKYGRDLVWVFTDGKLLQEKLVKKGLAKVAYLYGDYKYTDKLLLAENYAKRKKLNIWSNYNYNQFIILFILFIIILIVSLFNKKTRRKIINRIKKKVYNKTSLEIKNLFKWFF